MKCPCNGEYSCVKSVVRSLPVVLVYSVVYFGYVIVANCQCGPSCACGDKCKGTAAGCCPCICQGCDGSACKCEKGKCFCDKDCCAKKCSCNRKLIKIVWFYDVLLFAFLTANCQCGPSCGCGDKCKGTAAGCCPCICQGCDGSACKCEKDKCFCDKSCCTKA